MPESSGSPHESSPETAVSVKFDDLVLRMSDQYQNGEVYDSVGNYILESKKPLELLGGRFRHVRAARHFDDAAGQGYIIELRETADDELPGIVFFDEADRPLQIFKDGAPYASLSEPREGDEECLDLPAHYRLLTLQLEDRWPNKLRRT